MDTRTKKLFGEPNMDTWTKKILGEPNMDTWTAAAIKVTVPIKGGHIFQKNLCK